jgi:hypothetical protein
VSLQGKQVEMVAKDDITFRSLAGGVELSGGVVLDTVMLPHGGGGYKVIYRVMQPMAGVDTGNLQSHATPRRGRIQGNTESCHPMAGEDTR